MKSYLLYGSTLFKYFSFLFSTFSILGSFKFKFVKIDQLNSFYKIKSNYHIRRWYYRWSCSLSCQFHFFFSKQNRAVRNWFLFTLKMKSLSMTTLLFSFVNFFYTFNFIFVFLNILFSFFYTKFVKSNRETEGVLTNSKESDGKIVIGWKEDVTLLLYWKCRMLGFIEGVSLGRTNTNETWVQPHKALTPLSTQNLKANLGLRLILGFLTISHLFHWSWPRDGKNTRARRYPRIKSVTHSYYPRVVGSGYFNTRL